MNILITGLTGTLAPKVAAAAMRRGMQASGWDRLRILPEDAGACHAYLSELKPDAIVHLAMGAESWAGLLASYAAARHLPFVFTSSAMDECGHKNVPADIFMPHESERPSGREVGSRARWPACAG